MESWKDNAFYVQEKVHGRDGKPDWTKPYTRFGATEQGLYTYKPQKFFLDAVAKCKGMMPKPEQHNQNLVVSYPLDDIQHCFLMKEHCIEDTDNDYCFLVETLSENRKGYTLREFKDAKRARALYHTSGHHTVENF